MQTDRPHKPKPAGDTTREVVRRFRRNPEGGAMRGDEWRSEQDADAMLEAIRHVLGANAGIVPGGREAREPDAFDLLGRSAGRGVELREAQRRVRRRFAAWERLHGRVCEDCEAVFEIPRQNTDARRCPTCRDTRKAERAANAERRRNKAPKPPRTCRDCGEGFPAAGNGNAVRCPKCRGAA